jgi:hypothetical protein
VVIVETFFKLVIASGVHQFFYKKPTHLLIILNNSTMKPKSNLKNYKKFFGPPSDDYKHLSKPKARRLPRPSLIVASKTCHTKICCSRYTKSHHAKPLKDQRRRKATIANKGKHRIEEHRSNPARSTIDKPPQLSQPLFG